MTSSLCLKTQHSGVPTIFMSTSSDDGDEQEEKEEEEGQEEERRKEFENEKMHFVLNLQDPVLYGAKTKFCKFAATTTKLEW